jgi:hypothetical protein
MSTNSGSLATEAGAWPCWITAGAASAAWKPELPEASQSMAEKATASQDIGDSRKKRHWSAMTRRQGFGKPARVNADLPTVPISV